ncbi:CLUMA_CG019162, isoform A [Clunio marinus]|uniref:CLUMA_CG019162, isoform A n=1 Tax=Clunio marinus TaxID=568069 RepID=A0A1J1J0X0_9DIPT|nr:CLUMA_CG019162, isoform A [Clunio marinus]
MSKDLTAGLTTCKLCSQEWDENYLEPIIIKLNVMKILKLKKRNQKPKTFCALFDLWCLKVVKFIVARDMTQWLPQRISSVNIKS